MGIAEDEIDLVHGRKGLGIDLDGAAGHDQARRRPFSPRLADGLAGLAYGFGRDRAGVEHHGVGEAIGVGAFANGLGLAGVQPATKSHHLDRAPSCFSYHRRRNGSGAGGRERRS